MWVFKKLFQKKDSLVSCTQVKVLNIEDEEHKTIRMKECRENVCIEGCYNNRIDD